MLSTVMATALRLVVNEDVSPALHSALDLDAKQDNMTINDVACRIIATYYEVPFFPSGSPYRPNKSFRLRVPAHLHRELRIEAAEYLGTVRATTLNVLLEHYGLPTIEYRKRRRQAA